MVHTTIGVDPGKDGGLVALDARGAVLATSRMPILKQGKSDGGERTVVDADRVAAFLAQFPGALIVVEDVWSSPQMGVVGAFSFGDSRGVIRGCAAGLGSQVVWVSPLTWKGGMGVLVTPLARESKAARRKRLKAASIAAAQRMFPDTPGMTHDGVAEAALIAAYAKLFNPGQSPGTPQPTGRPSKRKRRGRAARRTGRT